WGSCSGSSGDRANSYPATKERKQSKSEDRRILAHRIGFVQQQLHVFETDPRHPRARAVARRRDCSATRPNHRPATDGKKDYQTHRSRRRKVDHMSTDKTTGGNTWVVEWRLSPGSVGQPSDLEWTRYEFTEYEAKCLVAAKEVQKLSPCRAPRESAMEWRAVPKRRKKNESGLSEAVQGTGDYPRAIGQGF